MRLRPLKRLLNPRRMKRIEHWSSKYGAFAAGIFRFTPGLRFPGHFMCGATKLSFTKFAMVDGTAALLSVPTQVLFIAFYGDKILAVLKQMKIVILILVLIAFVYLIVKRFRERRAQK